MGFIPGSLVQSLPEEDGGMSFILSNGNIPNYSELDSATKKLGGKLLQVYPVSRSTDCAALEVTGKGIIHNAGLDYGDTLVVRYDYGFIKARKVPPDERVIFMARLKKPHTGHTYPKLKLFGNWLLDLGFTPGTFVSAFSEPGLITFKVPNGNSENYHDSARIARKNKARVINVYNVQHTDKERSYPNIIVTGSFISRAGFALDDTLIARCERGIIKLRKLDFEQLGF
jgi:hypothetical protein